MKIAVLNLSNNITDHKTVSSSETLHIADIYRMLGHEVDVISNNDTENTISFENAKDPNYYDRVIVLNGAINFFGGAENKTIINNFKFMAKHKNYPILYFLTDLRLAYKPLWPAIKNRGWGYTEEEVTVDDIIIISQAHNLGVVREMHPGMKVIYAPLERYKLLSHTFKNENVSVDNKSVDVIYGGSFRAGNREKVMTKYFFDTDYSVEMYGNIKLSNFKKYKWNKAPEFTGKIRAEEVVEYNGKAYASIIIGDDNYNDNMITLRVWEVLMGDSIILIDESFDPEHKIMLDKLFYVRDKNDVKQRLDLIKKHKENFDMVMDFQRKRLSELFDRDRFLDYMKLILEANNFEN